MNYPKESKITSQQATSFPLKRKFAYMCIPLLILINAFFFWFYTNQKNEEIGKIQNYAYSRLTRQKEIINSFSADVIKDLRIILNHHELLDVIDQHNDGSYKYLVHDLLHMSKIKRVYDQIRYIAADGNEVIRINFNFGQPTEVSSDQLQNKGDRYYFKDTIKLKKNEIFFSPLDLNIENGQIETPLKPTIRIGAPVYNTDGTIKGIVIVNYLSKTLLDSFGSSIAEGADNVLMLNRDGYFLKGLSREDEWGFMYPERKHLTFEMMFPDLWQQLAGNESGTFVNQYGIFTYDTVFPMAKSTISSTGASGAYEESKESIDHSEYHWKLVHFISKAEFNASMAGLKKDLILLDLTICIIIVVITWFLALFSNKRKKAQLELKNAYLDLEDKVRERVKELTCLYDASRLFAKGKLEIKNILEHLIEIVPRGFRHPELTGCRVVLDDMVVQSNTFEHNKKQLSAPLKVAGTDRGTMDVSYCLDHPFRTEGQLHTEEKVLIETLAKQLSGTISKKEYGLEKEKLKEQLHHAQKMEAIGQLSGGIAHDFNNMLTVINGFAELGMAMTDDSSDTYESFEEILVAGNKAANLTRQLLVFSRKDAIQPMPLQINSAIEGAVKLLRRLVGESIQQEISLAQDLPLITADKTQIDQLLFNLVINARDAIESKANGKIRNINISTRCVQVDNEFSDHHLGLNEGSYILLEVNDTGTGMDQETQNNIFTPFFSTKGQKHGTGLGLSTVYGIVKQNKGTITVYSEPGVGSTFKIYWPAMNNDATVEYDDDSLIQQSIHLETGVILLVEDDSKLNQFCCKALEAGNLEVLSAQNGQQALDIIKNTETKIDILLTDIILPDINGKELAEVIKEKLPHIKILYTSGYTEKFFSENGILPSDINFLRKPYSVKELHNKIKETTVH